MAVFVRKRTCVRGHAGCEGIPDSRRESFVGLGFKRSIAMCPYFIRACPVCGNQKVTQIARTNRLQHMCEVGLIKPPDDVTYQCKCGSVFRVPINGNVPLVLFGRIDMMGDTYSVPPCPACGKTESILVKTDSKYAPGDVDHVSPLATVFNLRCQCGEQFVHEPDSEMEPSLTAEKETFSPEIAVREQQANPARA
jgi:hypothetical protein